MRKIISYWNPIKESGIVYSCDMVRLVFESKSDQMESLVRYFGSPTRMDITAYAPNFNNFKYKYLFTVECGESTATIGLVFNGTKREDNLKGFIEFNPNKCLVYAPLLDDIRVLLSRTVSRYISRFDLAIDIPFDRENVFMEKDSRKYSLEQNSFSSRTEYLGVRNNAGRVKLYNKTVESNLDYPLTRFEITFGRLTTDLDVQWNTYVPNVYHIDGQQELLLTDDLTNTQFVLVQMLRTSDNPSYYLKQLDYRMRKKIEPYIFGENAKLTFNKKNLYEIVSNLNELFNL